MPRPPAYPSRRSARSGRSVRILETRDQRGCVPPFPAELLDLGIELIDERSDRQLGSVAARLGEADRQVLAHPVDGEAEVELALIHRLAAVIHLPGSGRAFRDHLEHGLDVELRTLGEMNALGEALDQARDADLVDHLGQLPGARAA